MCFTSTPPPRRPRRPAPRARRLPVVDYIEFESPFPQALSVSGTTLTDEYWKAHRHLGFTWSELQQVARMGFQSAFLPQDDKVALLERVELEMGALP